MMNTGNMNELNEKSLVYDSFLKLSGVEHDVLRKKMSINMSELGKQLDKLGAEQSENWMKNAIVRYESDGYVAMNRFLEDLSEGRAALSGLATQGLLLVMIQQNNVLPYDLVTFRGISGRRSTLNISPAQFRFQTAQDEARNELAKFVIDPSFNLQIGIDALKFWNAPTVRKGVNKYVPANEKGANIAGKIKTYNIDAASLR